MIAFTIFGRLYEVYNNKAEVAVLIRLDHCTTVPLTWPSRESGV